MDDIEVQAIIQDLGIKIANCEVQNSALKAVVTRLEGELAPLKEGLRDEDAKGPGIADPSLLEAE